MSVITQPKVHIIILNWNGKEDTIECLMSLKALQYSNYEVIVVDNASTDGSVNEIKDKFPEITLLVSDINKGYAGGNNIGLRYALNHDTDYAWILNNDTVVDEFALNNLMDRITEDDTLGMCGSKVIYYNQRDTVQVLAGGSYNKWFGLTKNFGQYQHINAAIDSELIEQNLDFIIGASVLVSRSFLHDIGLMSEEYFLYFEEIDWGIRAKDKYKLGFASDSIIYHKEGASVGATNLDKSNKSKLSDYYLIKNRFKITYKFYPYLLPFIYLTTIYSIINRIKRNQWDRIPMILKICFTFNK